MLLLESRDYKPEATIFRPRGETSRVRGQPRSLTVGQSEGARERQKERERGRETQKDRENEGERET